MHGYEKGCLEGCAEVHGGLHRCVQSGAWRYMEGYPEVHGGVCRGVWRYAWKGSCHWLPLATIGLVGDNREFEVLRHFEVLYPLWVSNNLRILKIHHIHPYFGLPQ